MGFLETEQRRESTGGGRDERGNRAPVASSHSRTYAIVSILCAFSGLLLVPSIPGVLMAPLAIIFGFMAKSSGDRRLGLIGIWSGVVVTVLGIVLMVWFMTHPAASA